MKTDVLDRGPDNRQATGFGGEDVNLLGALPHIAKQAFNRMPYRILCNGVQQEGAKLSSVQVLDLSAMCYYTKFGMASVITVQK